MKYRFSNKRISGVLTILPETECRFEDEVLDPESAKAKRLKKIIGYGTRRRAKATTTVSDLLRFGFNFLQERGDFKKEEVGAIVVVTLCPDYILPQISSILHGELGLSRDVFCVDIPCACAGYITGLIESFMLLDQMKDKKVFLCTGEIFNRKAGQEERKEEVSFGGDIANISIVENCEPGYNDKIPALIYHDGALRNSLMVEYGAFRNPLTAEMAVNNDKNLPCSAISMDGPGVFNFAQREVPPLINEISDLAGVKMDDYDYFLFHQPNRFMLEKLATALGIPYEKLPMDITQTWGNSDSGTIPAVMTKDAAKDLLNKENLCCLSGFGGGLTWGAIVMHIGRMQFCETIESDL